jgi:DNA repair exonuclease SbcCD ATPase subunit|nr:MAG TPA: chromosome partition protein [Caudoviricetes sp.]
MKTVELKQLNIENYKKFESAEYQFAPRTMVFGKNRQGKTTLMDAYFDILTGKLADGTSPNNVRRKEDGEEVEGVVSRELTLLIDGEETMIRKETKKGKSSSTTKYQVDGFDYNQTKYKDFLKRIADPETIMMCSNARVFLNELRKSTASARATLEKMAGFNADKVLQDNPEVSEIIKNHSVEEVVKKLNKDRKDIQKKIDVKKVEIDTLKEQGIPDATVLEEKRGQVLNHLSELRQKEQRLSDSGKAYDELSYEIVGLKKSRDAIVSNAAEALQEEKRKIVSLLNDRQIEKMKEENHLRNLENELSKTENPKRLESMILQLQKKYKAQYAAEYDNSSKLEDIQNEQFDPTVAICPTCGQVLPADEMERLKAEFEQKKQERIKAELDKKTDFENAKQQNLREINEEGKKTVEEKKKAEIKREQLEKNIEASKKSIAILLTEISKTSKELESIADPDVSGNEEYQAVVAEIQKKQEQLDGLTNNSEEKAAVQAERTSAEKELTGIETKIEMAKQAVQKQAETLEQLNADRKKLGQEDSDIQQKLDMLKEFSIKKNQKLAEAINPHFKHFQFQFLDYTQDGEPVEVCKMICDGIGYFDGLNHSDQILCNIDLVAGLQELNGLKLPIWIDDAESVNEERFPQMEQQVIYLKVSDNELKVEEF